MSRPVDFVFNVKICKSGSNWRRVCHVHRLEFGAICKRWNIIWGAVTYFRWCLLREKIRLLQIKYFWNKTILLTSRVFCFQYHLMLLKKKNLFSTFFFYKLNKTWKFKTICGQCSYKIWFKKPAHMLSI